MYTPSHIYFNDLTCPQNNIIIELVTSMKCTQWRHNKKIRKFESSHDKECKQNSAIAST